LIGFYAKDDLNSIGQIIVADGEEELTARENLVIGINTKWTFVEKYNLNVEYASTAVTQDLRAESIAQSDASLAGLFMDTRGSTEFYDAFKLGVDTELNTVKVGINYERIDPGYETLGAYFFNNDFENITLNISTPLFKERATVDFNIGRQRDNLELQKEDQTTRTVLDVKGTLKLSDKISLAGGYSNFNSHTNQSLNQFDDINDTDLTDEALEALDFKQLSQNANASISWALSKTEKSSQNLNANYGFAASANETDGLIRIDESTYFHNAAMNHSLSLLKTETNVTTTLNYNFSDLGATTSQTYGGGLTIGQKLFKKKLNTSLGAMYNKNSSEPNETEVMNFKLNASTVLAKKHNLNLSIVQLFTNTSGQDSISELTATIGYSYNFALGGKK